MKTPVQQLFEYMEQNQYFIGNDLLAKYKELIDIEKEHCVYFAFKFRHEDFKLKEIKKEYDAIYSNGKKK
jgi:hypothetical protein